MATTKRALGAHIGVLSVDSSHQICETMFLFILVWNKQRIGLEVAMVDLEAGLVCNAYAISEGRGARMVIAGHIMELGRVEVDRENKLEKAKFVLVVVLVVGTGQSVRIWAEKCFRPGKNQHGRPNVAPLICHQTKPAILR